MVAPVKVAGDDGGPAWADAGRHLPVDDLPGLRRPPAAGAAISLDGQVRRILPQAEHARLAAAQAVSLLRRLAEHRRRHAQGRHLHRVFRTQHRLTSRRPPRCSGKTEDAAKYRDLFEGIKAAFNRAYVAPDGRIKGNTQAVLRAGHRIRPGRSATRAEAGGPSTWSTTSRNEAVISRPASSAPSR